MQSSRRPPRIRSRGRTQRSSCTVVIVTQMLMQRDIALAMNFEGSVRRKANYNGPSKFPTTRMGLATQIRQAFLDAQAYEAERAAAAKPDHKGAPPKRDLKLEALLPYLHGEKPVVLAAYESYEVEVAMGLAKEFHLKVILNHVTHAQDVLDEIASYHVPVIVGPIYDFPRPDERYDAVYSLPAELQKRGVKIALSSAGAWTWAEAAICPTRPVTRWHTACPTMKP